MLGFSLIELLITFVIIVILSVITIPSYHFFIDKSNEQAACSQLQHAIVLARHVAMVHHSSVLLCKDSEWRLGYRILSDNKTLFTFRNHIGGIIHWRVFPNNKSYLEFLPLGLPNAQNGSFWYCAKEKENPKWAIVFNQFGRIRVVNPDRNGEIKDDKGIALIC